MKKNLFALLVALMGAMSVFTSCKEDDDDEILNVPPDSIVVDGAKVLDLGDYSFNFPTDENKEVPWNYFSDERNKGNYGDIKFNMSEVYAKNDFAVVINIYEQIDEQAGKFTIGDLEDFLDKNIYCEDGRYNIEKNTNAKLGTAKAIKYKATEKETGNYLEQYLVYIEKTKKILVVLVELPADVKEQRFAEVQTILNSFKLK